jgi:DEAD/DEAH box helicase domain-containing protein
VLCGGVSVAGAVFLATKGLRMPNTPAVDSEAVLDLVTRAGLIVVERQVLPARPASRREVPEALHATVREVVRERFPDGIYAHQAEAIERVLAGKDVCLATPTASGKTLAFMSAAAHVVLTDASAKVLALYPMKALIRDQLGKWEDFLAPLGIGVGFIDGSVPTDARGAILKANRGAAMTPDVAHAWLMSHLASPEVKPFIRALRLLVLDEAHVYEGVFGTNMAYFLRRLAVVAAPHSVICSTATIGEPERSMERLTGRAMSMLGADADGSAGQEKTLLLAKADPKTSFDAVVKLLAALATDGRYRFLAFADSRKAVERLTAAAHRNGKPEQEGEADDAGLDRVPTEQILPYRAGYEEEDRRAIQDAIGNGRLAGVVSTSALELGLDIGEIDVVVLTNSPPSTKAFHQRIGRAGRRRPAVCVIVDDVGVVGSLPAYLQRSAEPGWIYVENRYIQYSQAICAAAELQAIGKPQAGQPPFADLPDTFSGFVANELNPTRAVDEDLFHLKQQGQASPHYEFPIRNAAEQGFTVRGGYEARLGTLSYAQLLREAYPGAVYYYMARPYRVYRVDHRQREVHVRRERFLTTQPTTQAMVFAQFGGGVLQALRSDAGFVVEAELQVSERVTGFVEQRGRNKTAFTYAPGSEFAQKPLTRYFKTTGVCFAFPGKVPRSELLAQRLLEAFCRVCGVLERDAGSGLFQASRGPFDAAPAQVQGFVVYDGTVGSLRLTQQLMGRMQEVLAAALEMDDPGDLNAHLEQLDEEVAATIPVAVNGLEAGSAPPASSDEVLLAAPGSTAMLLDGASGPVEVIVVGYRYTPQGLLYELAQDKPGKWQVDVRRIQPIPSVTNLLRVNLVTGDEEPVV